MLPQSFISNLNTDIYVFIYISYICIYSRRSNYFIHHWLINKEYLQNNNHSLCTHVFKHNISSMLILSLNSKAGTFRNITLHSTIQATTVIKMDPQCISFNNTDMKKNSRKLFLIWGRVDGWGNFGCHASLIWWSGKITSFVWIVIVWITISRFGFNGIFKQIKTSKFSLLLFQGLFPPFDSSVLEPNFNLGLSQIQGTC